MHLLKQRDHRAMPWKNGGGVTFEVAVGPIGAGIDAFDWRISMARVETPGPFSAFPGCDRILTVLSGGPMTLAVGDAPVRQLDETSAPFAFAADVPSAAETVDTPLLDLNVMVRRGRATATVSRHRRVNLRVSPRNATTLVLARGGSAAVSSLHKLMADGDVLVLAAFDPPVTISPAPEAVLYEIRIATHP